MSLLQYFIPEFEVNTNILTLLALSLPLTTLWSAAAVRHGHNHNHGSGRHFWGGSSEKSLFDHNKTSGGSFSHPTSTLIGSMQGPKKIKSADHFDRLYPDLHDTGKITVERNFSISSNRVWSEGRINVIGRSMQGLACECISPRHLYSLTSLRCSLSYWDLFISLLSIPLALFQSLGPRELPLFFSGF